MLIKQMTYGYNDVCIKPAIESFIEHRGDCITTKSGYLPIFTAPMTSVINKSNYKIFDKNGIIPIIPRTEDFDDRVKFATSGTWAAFSLNEFDRFINEHESLSTPAFVLIDVANGNMEQIFELSRKAKEKFGKTKIVIMAGNIANPMTYLKYCECGIDYVRVNIGTGEGCITQSNTAVGYGVVNLLDEIHNLQSDIIDGDWNIKCMTKVIADGGIRNYSDVIKALALGADYVMIGGLFSRLIESCAITYAYDSSGQEHILYPLDENVKITESEGCFFIEKNTENGPEVIYVDKIYKVFYGMASKRGQEDMFGKKKRTSEGIVKHLECTTNIHKWVENMNDCLATAMSYSDIKDVSDFNADNVEVYLRSNNLQNSINK